MLLRVLTHRSDGWNDCVVEAIEYGQRISHDWLLTGDVHNSLDGWSNKSSISGVSAIGWNIVKPAENLSDD